MKAETQETGSYSATLKNKKNNDIYKLKSQAKSLLLSMTRLQVLCEVTFIAILVQRLAEKLWLPGGLAQGSSVVAISVDRGPVVATFPVKSPAGPVIRTNNFLTINSTCSTFSVRWEEM